MATALAKPAQPIASRKLYRPAMLRLCGAAVLAAWFAGSVRYAMYGGEARISVSVFTVLLLAAGGFQLRAQANAYTRLWIFLLLEFLPEHLAGSSLSVKPHILPAAGALLWLAACAMPSRTPRGLSLRAGQYAGALLAGFAACFFLLGTTLAILKLRAFGYVGQDVAYFMQCLHTGLHGASFSGHLFWSNQYHDLLYTRTVSSDFAGHNQPVLFLLLPFYRLAPHAETLFLIRNLVLALSAWPLYRLCRLSFEPSASALFTAAFLLAPAVLFQNFYDFAPLSLACLPLLCALLFYSEHRFGLCMAALLACLLVREDLVFVAAGLGLMAAGARRPLRWSLLPVSLAVVWSVFTWKLLLPHFQQGAVSAVNSCFAYLGDAPVRTLAHHPGLVFTRNTETYIAFILTPFGLLLPFASPASLIALVYLAINVLGDAGCESAIIFRHYALVPTILLVPGVLAAVRWAAHNPRLRIAPSASCALLLLSSVLCTALLLGPAELAWWHRAPWQVEAQSVAKLLPPDASVAVPRYMLPLVANRDFVYQSLRLLDYHHPAAGFIVLDTDDIRSGVNARTEPGYRRLQGLLRQIPEAVVYQSPNYRVYRLDPKQAQP